MKRCSLYNKHESKRCHQEYVRQQTDAASLFCAKSIRLRMGHDTSSKQRDIS